MQMPLANHRMSQLGRLIIALAFTIHAIAATAQTFPVKGMRMILPFPAGGGADINARKLADRLAKLWLQPVVVENVPGAGGGIAAAAVANAKPDGYTLFFATDPVFVVNPFLYDKLPYDPENGLAPVVHTSETQLVMLVNPALSVTRVSELIALGKARPGSLNFGSGGVGTSIHLAGELFKIAAGIEMTHVPYKGSGPAIAAVLSNDIQLTFDGSTSAIGQIRGRRLRGIAIAGITRLPALPDLPTFDESGLPGFVAGVTYGLFVPAQTSAALVSVINRDVNIVLRDAEYRKQMAELGLNLLGGSPEKLRAFLVAEREKWGGLIRKLGIKGE